MSDVRVGRSTFRELIINQTKKSNRVMKITYAELNDKSRTFPFLFSLATFINAYFSLFIQARVAGSSVTVAANFSVSSIRIFSDNNSSRIDSDVQQS